MTAEGEGGPITAGQCRAARALVGMSQPELAEAAEVGLSTVLNFERGHTTPRAKNLADIVAALEAAGVVFLPATDSTGPGVALRIEQPRGKAKKRGG